jgi:O-methyltransferase involved in polyketide biosynthesis
MSDDQRSGGIPVDLDGVPETLLWTLYYRAQEAGHPRSVLPDPLAVDLVAAIDYPFAQRLGQGARRGQWQGLRARTFDDAVRRFLAKHPGDTVVALGEGLETQFWRVDDGKVRWVGVDLPETAALRRQVLPRHPRRLQVDASVLHDDWLDGDRLDGHRLDGHRLDDDRLDDGRLHATGPDRPGAPVLLTAQGLLMYLSRNQVHGLITRCAERFPGGSLVFDGVPRWTAAATTSRARQTATSSGAPVAPPMPWWMNHAEATVLRKLPGVSEIRRLHPPRGRGLSFGRVLPVLERVPGLRSQLLSVWTLSFDG